MYICLPMKKTAIAFLVIIILIQCSMRMATVAYYQLNKKYIASVLCENKENKSMHCDGKCYLTKKIKAQEEQEKRIPSVLKGLEELVLFCNSFEISFSIPSFQIKSLVNNAYLLKHYTSPASSIFQPPQ